MHKVLQRLFLFEKFEMKTKLSKEEACQKLKAFIADNKGKYYGHISEKKFFIIPFPIIHLIIHFLCFKPAKQLKEELEFIL